MRQSLLEVDCYFPGLETTTPGSLKPIQARETELKSFETELGYLGYMIHKITGRPLQPVGLDKQGPADDFSTRILSSLRSGPCYGVWDVVLNFVRARLMFCGDTSGQMQPRNDSDSTSKNAWEGGSVRPTQLRVFGCPHIGNGG